MARFPAAPPIPLVGDSLPPERPRVRTALISLNYYQVIMEESMRLLFCTHAIDNGGSGRSLFVLARQLSHRHDIQVLSMLPPDPSKAALGNYAALGIPVHVFPHPSLRLVYAGCAAPPEATAQGLPSAPGLPQTLSAWAEAVCFNGFPCTSLIPFFPEQRKVLIAREVVLEESPELDATGVFLRQHLHAAAAIGPVEARQLARWGIPHSIIYNSPMKPPRFHPLPPAPPVRFGFFSELRPQKGHDILLNACLEAATVLRALRAEVHFYGVDTTRTDHPLVEQVMAFLARTGLEDVVRLHGWTDNVEEAMLSMHCVVKPDGAGHPWTRDIIEALSLGRPVIATGTEEGFIRHGENGLLLPPGNEYALAAALARMAENPAVLELAGRKAAATAAALFHPIRNAAGIERLLTGHNRGHA